jgi:NTP pyrophosphatase (non-canonical NTP hydrolase)
MMEQDWNKAMVTYYGANDRARLLMEECGELVQAANKILRYPDSHEARVNLLEEMVDVSIMLEQVRTLFNYSDLEWGKMEQYKVNRCKKRFFEDAGTKTDKVVIRKDCNDCDYHRIKGDEKCVKYITDNGKPCMIFIRCANRESEE